MYYVCYGNNIGYYFVKSSEAVIWASVSIHTTVVSSLQHIMSMNIMVAFNGFFELLND